MALTNDGVLNALLRRKKREKGFMTKAKSEPAATSSPKASPIKIKISQTKSMTEKEFEDAVREHRRKMSKKYLTKQVNTIYLYDSLFRMIPWRI